MRYTRIIASFILTTSLIFVFCIGSSAAAVEDTLYCDEGVVYYAPMNTSNGLWVDYTPTIDVSATRFTFGKLEAVKTSGNAEYSFNFIAFILTPNNTDVKFDNGYVYTYTFEIRSTRNTTPNITGFDFGVCSDGFDDALPLADVIYTYDISGTTTVNYYVTVTINVDDNFNQSAIPHPDVARLYLRMRSNWSDTFTLIASNMTVTKSVGEGAYYQASLDAIESLPNTEYDFTLNKMPNAEGVVEQIKGDADDITEELNLQLTNALGVLLSLEGEEPLVYMPKMKIPILNLDLANYTKGYIAPDGYFRPLDMIEDMDSSGQALATLELARKFLSVVLVFAFCTVGLEKMLKIEWWF